MTMPKLDPSIVVFDFHYDITSHPGSRAILRKNGYSRSKVKPQVCPKRLQSIVIASAESLDCLHQELRNLKSFKYNVDISLFTGNGDETAVSYSYILEPTSLPADMDPETANNLREWARKMIKWDARSILILPIVLRLNRRLRSVELQLQPTHNILETISALASLEKLRALNILGSDTWRVTPATAQHATEIALHILERCRTLRALIYQTIPTSQQFPPLRDPKFVSLVTKLDLSAINQSPCHGQDVSEFPFHVDRIVTHCPNLEWLALPQALSQENLSALTPTLAQSCSRLRALFIERSDLNVSEFQSFMGTITTLTELELKDCQFMAYTFTPWILNSRVELERIEVISCDEVQAYKLLSMVSPGALVKTQDRWTWTSSSSAPGLVSRCLQ